MMATLSDATGQFMASAFDEDVCRDLEEAAKSNSCGLITVELDRRPGDEMPRVSIKRFQPLDSLARRTRLEMTIRVPSAEAIPIVARELADATGGNGVVRFVVPLSNGGQATVLAGREFALDGELAARIARITGEGTVNLAAQEPPKLALVG